VTFYKAPTVFGSTPKSQPDTTLYPVYATQDIFGYCLPSSISNLPENQKKGYEALTALFEQNAAGSFISNI